MIRGNRKSADEKAKKFGRVVKKSIDVGDADKWSSCDPDKWIFSETEFGGSSYYKTEPKTEVVRGLISEGITMLKDNPRAYLGCFYQTDMSNWPDDQQQYTLVKRTGSHYQVKAEGSGFTWVKATYQALPPASEVTVEADEYTDNFSLGGYRLGEPVMPGRGQGVDDVPCVCLLGNVDPSDVVQGQVGDCWLLSAISAFAEYSGAVAQLFKNTEDMVNKPSDAFNRYTVTLFNLPTWEAVDILIDERLCKNPSGSALLGATPSPSGELWTCYLEKAVAAHCGGWDEIDGATPCHGWMLLTGSREQYTFSNDGSGFSPWGALNPNTGDWEEKYNSPHQSSSIAWPMPWPEVGGGGDINLKLDGNDFFERMCAWEDANYIMACGTRPGSNSEDQDGIVDGHAYTVLRVVENAGGTDFDLVQVRNPWHQGEFTSGMWDDDGPGWEEYPEVKDALNPVNLNDGVFWLDKSEFFEYFPTIYLCAVDMSTFVEK